MRKIDPNNYRMKWTDSDVEKHWDNVSGIYVKENDKVKNTHDQRFLESVKWLELQDDQIIINVTSRDCEANDYILKANDKVRVINTEISQGLMNEAARIRPYVEQVKIETYSKLPFEDAYFDSVLSLETLEHVEEPGRFLQELHRVCKKEGRMVLSCPPATSEIPYQIFTFLFGGHGEGPHKFPSSKEVKQLLFLTGWELIHHYGTMLFPVGPKSLQDFGERIIRKFQNSLISELGIRQFYVCKRS